jgi:hypothetical protein
MMFAPAMVLDPLAWLIKTQVDVFLEVASIRGRDGNGRGEGHRRVRACSVTPVKSPRQSATAFGGLSRRPCRVCCCREGFGGADLLHGPA